MSALKKKTGKSFVREGILTGTVLFLSLASAYFLNAAGHDPEEVRALILSGLLLYVSVRFLCFAEKKRKKHYDRDRSFGDAKWLSGRALCDYRKRFSEPFHRLRSGGKNNMILAKGLMQSLNCERTDRTANVMNIAGSGRGKTFRFVVPNLLQANCSYVTTDPSGELYRNYGAFFEHMGYRVRVLNLSRMEQSNHYNPFAYIRSDKDIMVLVDTLIANTNPPGEHASDPFWEKAEAAMFNALIALQYHYMDPCLRNFSVTLELLRMAEVAENGFSAESGLNALFEMYRSQDPDGFAFKQFGNVEMGSDKTLSSLLVSCAFRIRGFDLPELSRLTSDDDMELDLVGDEKTALFIVIPTGERTFNFLASLLYSQLFIRLYDYCENEASDSYAVRDRNHETVRTFRCGAEGKEETKRKAEAYVKALRDLHVVYNPAFDWYELRTPGGEFAGYRKTGKEAEKAKRLLASCRAEKCGNCLSIHTRFMLDEFCNIGSIPDFDTKVSTIRKYHISVTVILQSLSQLKSRYKEQWETLMANCSNIIYMGGGADLETARWFSELCGRETRLIMGESFSSGGQTQNIQAQGAELISPAELRTLKDRELVLIPVGMMPYRGEMYETEKHRNWKYAKQCGRYVFNPEKAAYFAGLRR